MAMTDLVQGTGQFAAKISLSDEGAPLLHMAFWDTGTGSHTVLLTKNVMTANVCLANYTRTILAHHTCAHTRSRARSLACSHTCTGT